MKKNTLKSFLAFALLATAMSSCSDDTPSPDDHTDDNAPYSYIVAARAVSGEDEAQTTALIQTDDISSGSISISDGEILDDNAIFPYGSIWLAPTHTTLYNFNYGNPASVGVYGLNADNKLVKTDYYTVASSAGAKGAYGLYGEKMVNIFSYTEDNTAKVYVAVYDPSTKSKTEKSLSIADVIGFEPSTPVYFAGIAAKDGKFYTSVVVDKDASAPARIVEFDSQLNYQLITNDKIAYSGSRYRSLFSSMMDTDENGNLYVFSSSYEEGTTVPSGAVRINKGESTVDEDYYFDIDAQTDGRSVYKAWHISGDYFLIQTYTTTTKEINPDVRKLAIADMKNKTVKWVTGIPNADQIITMGIANTPAFDGDKAIVAITTNENPYIYIIDAATAVATQGAEVDAGQVIGITKLKKN